MYYITKKQDHYLVECMIQDGWERWHKHNRQEAINSLIESAKILNHTTITEKDIFFGDYTKLTEQETPTLKKLAITTEELQLLQDIRNKKKFVTDHPTKTIHYIDVNTLSIKKTEKLINKLRKKQLLKDDQDMKDK